MMNPVGLSVTLCCTPRDGGTCPRRFEGAAGMPYSQVLLHAASTGWLVQWVAPPGATLSGGEARVFQGTHVYRCPDHVGDAGADD